MSAQPTPPAAPDMVNIEINGVPLQAPKGSMVIQAADKAGIAIPRFCYHEKLPIAANCRMCLVEVEKMPKPAPACATPVMDGMKIATRSDKALKSQRNVMEFLLINHPLDCPICDQGGECELQDVSLGYGRSVSRYVERKRVVADEDIGPLVATEMTRCIHCTRCVRFTADVAGTFELGGMYRGERLQIGTYDGKPLTTELSGNVIDVCPVGALTNKVYRFKARPWELVARESVGYHDALGSNLFVHARRGEILRTVPRDNESINECWLSDRDRYSHQGLYAGDRLAKPMLKRDGAWVEAGWDEALAAAAALLRAQAGEQLGMLVHPSATNEEGALLARLAQGLGCSNLDHRLHALDLSDAAVAAAFQAPVTALEAAPAALLVGCNLRHELPLVHQRLHKAGKRGAKLFALNPVDFEFTFPLAGKRIVAPSQLVAALEAVVAAAGGQGGDAAAQAMAAALKAEGAVIVLGAIAEGHPQAARLRALAAQLAAATGAALDRIPQGANALGLARHGVLPTGLDARAMLAQPRQAYLTWGLEPALDLVDPTAGALAMANAKVVAFSAYAPESLKRVADVILPIALLPETEGSLVNLDGITQRVQAGGKPVGESRPGWRVLRALGEALGLEGFGFTDFAGLQAGVAPVEVAVAASAAPAVAAGEGLERVATTPIYRADAVLRRAAALQSHPLNPGPRVVLHPEDALALGLADGAVAKVGDGRGTAALPVATSVRVAKGAAWIESAHDATAPLAPAGALAIVRA